MPCPGNTDCEILMPRLNSSSYFMWTPGWLSRLSETGQLSSAFHMKQSFTSCDSCAQQTEPQSLVVHRARCNGFWRDRHWVCFNWSTPTDLLAIQFASWGNWVVLSTCTALLQDTVHLWQARFRHDSFRRCGEKCSASQVEMLGTGSLD